ncbi:ATP-binding protein [Lentibacillus saliphilus]|uniref:ATP-binding protein n=1 Tax=Lentibacillus saliphilus TaxID=2737028 RepID=UPI001C2F9116|nr:ATP-binding protein [Lentibacillus saliphilus]
MFSKPIKQTLLILTVFIITAVSFPLPEKEAKQEALTLTDSTDKLSLYPAISMIKDRNNELTITDVTSGKWNDQFIPTEDIEQESGFFETATWLRFDIRNESEISDWLLEFAFPLIYELHIYEQTNNGIIKHKMAGANLPFDNRDINHRNFIFNLQINPGEERTFYVKALGGGDLHPPIILWNNEAFFDKLQVEFLLLGLFYGIVLVMIVYNLFLYISLRIKSYLYYVIVITCTLMGKLSINGLGFQYVWPNAPEWNLIATPTWVSLACIFILIFTRRFLDVDQYIPSYKYIAYGLMTLNGFTLLLLPVSHYTALNFMVIGAFSTFVTVLVVAFMCLKRGARQARFYIIGWLIFLTGVFITILERSVVLPYSLLTEYAGQGALVAEVVLLSFALADKIKIMRTEKEAAEKQAKDSQSLAMENLKKVDTLKDEFLAVTSHELRTPLYGMIGIAESLRDGIAGKASTEMKEQLSMLITSGNRLTHLVNDILDFSKLKYDALELQLKPVYVEAIVDIVITVSKPLIKNKPIKLIKNLDETLPPVFADENRLQQILYNLLDNAIKYTDNGTITITATVTDGGMQISVSDTGKGIPERERKNIFNPFQQVDHSISRSVGGTGIGLSITKRLVDLHGGRLTVDSKLGKGSTFSVMLPIYSDKQQWTKEATVTMEPLHFSKTEAIRKPVQDVSENTTRILITDDEAVNLQVLMNQLVLEGYDVIPVFNGEEALRIVEEQEIDLVILDIMMPHMSGYDVCHLIRQKHSLMELPILMLTAKNQLQDTIAAFEAGANDYLVKPCEKQELLSRVKTLVQMRALNQELIQMNIHLEEKVQKRTEALKIANDELQEMNKELIDMADSRRQLLANIAHELGTPITLIHGYVQSLQKGVVALNDGHYNQLVFDKINVLNRLVSDLFDLSKLEAGKATLNMKEVPVGKWLDQLYNKCEFAVLQGNRTFNRIDLPPNSEHAICVIDIERMDQVFSNLISNAIKNTSEHNGCISIHAIIDDEKGRLNIEVHDNGIGIKEDDIPYIFERFYKGPFSEEHKNGTGLGLTIAKEIIHSHKGSIHVASTVNKGTTFYIDLPVMFRSANEQ